MEDTVYIYCGYSYGTFTSDRTGELVDYCNVFLLSPQTGRETADRHFGGYKAEKFRCISPDAWSEVKPQDKVNVSWGRKDTVVHLSPLK